MTKHFLGGVMLTLLIPALVFAQDAAGVQRMFEAGRYQEVVQAAQPDADPAILYTAAQSQQRLGASEQALDLYRQLADRPEGDVWHFIGLSGQQLVGGDTEGALAAAQQAVSMAGGLADAQYQLGLVQARRDDWRNSAAAFDRAAELNPRYAYAHYFGGLMHYKTNRVDRMANHFEQFLKLAPDAPERPEVLQIMRTVRGR